MDDRTKRRTDRGSPWSNANALRRSPRQLVGDAFDRLIRAIGVASMVGVGSMVGVASMVGVLGVGSMIGVGSVGSMVGVGSMAGMLGR